uniref:Glucose-induced degradation protein 4 homolog n=1 Tax=Rhizophora mucronata TaxID=61149 RepID=A0A2P2JWE5_RHIMU
MPVRVVESSAPSQVSGANSGSTFPPVCTLLSVGQAFSGTQNVSSLQKDEAWRVNVRIQGCDLDHGYLCGTMEALNVPMADTPVITFWEGEIVDGTNYTFFTGNWEATYVPFFYCSILCLYCIEYGFQCSYLISVRIFTVQKMI